MLARLERFGGIGAHGEALARENELPALAEIHRGLEVHLQPVRSRSAGATYAFEPCDADGLRPGSRARARQARETFAEYLKRGMAVGILNQRAVEPVVAAHELGGEQCRRLVVERGRRAFLCDQA